MKLLPCSVELALRGAFQLAGIDDDHRGFASGVASRAAARTRSSRRRSKGVRVPLARCRGPKYHRSASCRIVSSPASGPSSSWARSWSIFRSSRSLLTVRLGMMGCPFRCLEVLVRSLSVSAGCASVAVASAGRGQSGVGTSQYAAAPQRSTPGRVAGCRSQPRAPRSISVDNPLSLPGPVDASGARPAGQTSWGASGQGWRPAGEEPAPRSVSRSSTRTAPRGASAPP